MPGSTPHHAAPGSRRRWTSRALVVTIVAGVVATIAVVALAAWLATGAGNSHARAQIVTSGNAPTVGATGSAVTVSWSSSTLSGGGPVSGYVIRRYTTGGTIQTIGSACAGTIAALTCTEAGVPNGTWRYSATPVRANWAGNESATASVTVAVAPTVTSASPSSRDQGTANQSIAVTGTNFAPDAVGSFSGTGITVNSTNFDSASQVTVNISVASGATVGLRNVSVTNPDASAGTCTGCFTVNAVPTVLSTSPPSRAQGASGLNVAVTGTNFAPGAVGSFSGTGITVNSTTFDRATQVTLNISVASGATIGGRNVTVTNPDGRFASCTGCFTVTAVPTVVSASPPSRAQGAANQNIVVTGTGFLAGAATSFPGSGITVNSTTVNSATQVTVNISVGAGAATGARNITVTNTDAGSGTCTGCFTVTAGSVQLGSAGAFSVLGGTTVTNAGLTILGGSVGVAPGTAITGFPPGSAAAMHGGDPVAVQAQLDLTAAYSDAVSRAPTGAITVDLGGQTLGAGVYNSPTTMGLHGTLTLDGQGDPNAVFVFQMGTTLTTGALSNVNLINGAQACHVFWQIGSSATTGAASTLKGTMLVFTSITMGAGANVEGHALARGGAVTLSTNLFTQPTCT